MDLNRYAGLQGNALQGAAFGRVAAQQNIYAEQKTKQTAAQEHADRLSAIANQLEGLNGKLATALDRAVGPRPPEGREVAPEAPRDGIIHVAQFSAERIHRGLDNLDVLLSRLDEII